MNDKSGANGKPRRNWKFILGISVAGIFVGALLVVAGAAGLAWTSTEAFCTGCHEMHDNVFAELKTTIHYSNRSGVRAVCSDCHVPHEWTRKMARKMQASKEVWGKIFGTINTREKFGAFRTGCHGSRRSSSRFYVFAAPLTSSIS